MKHDKFIIVANFLLLLVVAILLLGCQPYMTYEELSDGAESDPKIQKRLDRFEAHAEDANEFFEQRHYCSISGKCNLHCVWRGIRVDVDRTEFKDLDDTVRWYRKIRHACRFIARR